jgi:carbamoyltransferase
LQIVREDTDPVAFAYLKALGRRTGVEVEVNTSFNVAAPIAQSPLQALDTLRRANGGRRFQWARRLGQGTN